MNFLFITIKKIYQSSRKAFTLVELLVVLGLFSGIATLALGTLFNTQTINGRLQETQAILDNVNLSVQIITRDIRFGSDFYCTSAVPATIPTVRKNCSAITSGGGDVLIFRSPDATSSSQRVGYYLDNGTLYKDEYLGYATNTLQMTSDEVSITSLLFFVQGANTSDGSSDEGGAIDYGQPLITLLISGQTKSPHQSVSPVSFSVQTHVSPNELDNR